MGQDFEDSYLTYPTTGRNAHGVCHNCTDWKLKENTTTNGSTKASSSREKRALTLMSRTVFYAMIKDKLRRYIVYFGFFIMKIILISNPADLVFLAKLAFCA